MRSIVDNFYVKSKSEFIKEKQKNETDEKKKLKTKPKGTTKFGD